MLRFQLAVALCASLVALVVPSAAAANTQEENLILKTADTPFLRLEQTNGSGFTPQTWDVAGNEANFFVRDVTGGSKLPFRIRPGAPTSSIDIAANGDVGLGTASPSAPLQLARSGGVRAVYSDTSPGAGSWATGIPAGAGSFTIGEDGTEPVFELQSYGDLDLGGSLSEAANPTTVTELQDVDSAGILAGVASLPIQSWRFSGAPVGDRHLGPLADDFSSAFGLGEGANLISPADEAGVSLAAVQALTDKLGAAEAATQALSSQNKGLTGRIAAIESSAPGVAAQNQALSAQVASLSTRVAELEPLRTRVGKLAKQLASLRKAVNKLGK
ncbi:MAG TPA: hypothetical protein VII45_13095 [Solirubrobacterales bacterium]